MAEPDELAAEADAGVEQQRVDRAVLLDDRAVQALDAVVGRQVGLDRDDDSAGRTEQRGGAFDLRVVGADQDVEVVLEALPGELESDPG